MTTLYNGDCLVEMRKIPDKSVDMILCDLPYGTTACAWDNVIPFEPLWESYKRIVKENGAIVLFCIEPFTSRLICSNIGDFKEKLTWEKHRPSNFGCAKYMHLKYSEDIVVFAHKKCVFNPQLQRRVSDRVKEAQKGNSKQWNTHRKTEEVSFATHYEPRSWDVYNAEYKYPSNILVFPAVVSNSKEKTAHPTQKPVKLCRYLIRTYTNEGDTVLDNTMGSGTTGVACVMEKRNFIGIELDEEYFKIAKQRIENEESQTTLF